MAEETRTYDETLIWKKMLYFVATESVVKLFLFFLNPQQIMHKSVESLAVFHKEE